MDFDTSLDDRLFKIYRTVTEMLVDRGYNVPANERGMTFEKFIERFGVDDNVIRFALPYRYPHGSGDTNKDILMFYAKEASIGAVKMKECFTKMQHEGLRRGIIINPGKVTPSVKKYLIELRRSKYYIEHFSDAELVINVTKHDLVPTHILLNKTELAALLAKHKIKAGQLPNILSTDPVARYFGLRRGQVVKIIRKSVTSGHYITYRIVV